ncbi:MAG: DUF1836 domain-containing protein [Tissierellia bacterium]|nr:DUF1836 domain-containing protein [Tissierellia bacterium]
MDVFENLFEFRLPRWEELPDFGIYNDQLVTLVTNSCKKLYLDSDNILTASMINNYVKLGYLKKPDKKKYYKGHIANLIIITALKQIMSLDIITKGINYEISSLGAKEGYDSFCEEFEKSMEIVLLVISDDKKAKEVLLGKDYSIKPELKGIKAATVSLCCKLITDYYIENRGSFKPQKQIIDEGEQKE